MFAIIVCGTLGVLAIHLASPILLSPAEEGSGSEAGESTVVAEPGDGGEDQVGGYIMYLLCISSFAQPNFSASHLVQALPSPFEADLPPTGPRRAPGSGPRLASLGLGEGSAAGGGARRGGSTPNMIDQLVGRRGAGFGRGRADLPACNHFISNLCASQLETPATTATCFRSRPSRTTSCWPSFWTPFAC